MAQPQRQQPAAGAGRDGEVRGLALDLFARTYPAARGKTAEAVAQECITAARAFFRAWDDQQTKE